MLRSRQSEESREMDPNIIWGDKDILGIMHVDGIIGKPMISLFWSTKEVLETPFFQKTMTRDLLTSVLRFLHFYDNSQNPGIDQLHKLRNLFLFHYKQVCRSVHSQMQHSA